MFNEKFAEVLNKKNITTATPVQETVIPLIQNTNDDLIVVSETGSGKTLSYLLPLLEKIDLSIKTPQVLIISPTHELSSQIYKVAKELDINDEYKPTLIIGGSSLKKQVERLKDKPKIIIGSWGRVLELNQMKKLKMHTIKTIVLDEGDRLVDEQNLEGITKVIKTTLKDRRLLYFSATIDKKTSDILNGLMNEPKLVEVENKIPDTIEHYYITSNRRDKIDNVRKVIYATGSKKAIVFVNNPVTIMDIVDRLNYKKIKATGLYGSKNKNKRINAIKQFREQGFQVLVTSDLTSRGIDIDSVDLVINYDVPESSKYYQHRCGRTGRRNEKGICVSLATDGEVALIKKLKKLDIEVVEKKLSHGELV